MKVDRADVDLFCKNKGIKMPSFLKDIYENSNGEVRNKYFFHREDWRRIKDLFFIKSQSKRNYDFNEWVDIGRDRGDIPKGLVAFGLMEDDFILFSQRKRDEGAVYIWNTDTDENPLEFVDSSVEAFLSRCVARPLAQRKP